MSILLFSLLAGLLFGYAIASARVTLWKRRAERWQAEATEAQRDVRRWKLAWESACLHRTRPIGSLIEQGATYGEVEDFAPRVVEVPR